MKAVAYVRVSTQDQSVTRQIQDIERYCQYKGLTLIRTPFEETMSGAKHKRPVSLEMLDYVKANAGNIDELIVSELSRLGRNYEVLQIVETLTELKINIHNMKDGSNTLTEDKEPSAFGKLLVNIMNGLSEYELDTLRYRIKSGLRASANSGHRNGGKYLPYGYERSNEYEGDKRYKLNPDEVEMIKYVYELYLQGNGTKRIKDIMNAKGYKTRTGVKWSEITVNRILHNHIYIGKKEYKGEYIDLPELRIIDDKTFETVQERLKNNYNKAGINVRYDYKIERGRIICGVCGKTYYAHKRADNSDNVYKCISRRYSEPCGNYGINIDKLTTSIESILSENFAHILMGNVDNSEIDSKIVTIQADIDTLDRAIKKNRTEETNLIKFIIQATVDTTTANEQLKQIQAERERMINRQTQLTSNLNGLIQVREQKGNLQGFAKMIREQGVQKDLLNKIVNRITIYPAPDKHLTTAKNDKTVRVELTIGTVKLSYYLSHYYKGYELIHVRPFDTVAGGITYTDNLESSYEDFEGYQDDTGE